MAEPIPAPSHLIDRATLQLAAIVESSDDAILTKDLNGIITSWNAGAERLFGYTAEETVGRSVTLLFPPGREDEEPQILARIRRGERVAHYETVRRRKDGSLVDISLTVSPLKDEAGRVVGASKIARDITRQKRAQEEQELLLREMRHRIKNLFSLTSSLVALSARSARTPAELAEKIQFRIAALARAHELTVAPGEAEGREDQTATLHDLLQTIVAPHLYEATDEQLTVSGANEVLASDAVTPLALVLNELATNAAKYGALAHSKGRVRFASRVEGDELVLVWHEVFGKPVAGPPDHVGFGTRLMRIAVELQLGGTLTREWHAQSLEVVMRLPGHHVLL